MMISIIAAALPVIVIVTGCGAGTAAGSPSEATTSSSDATTAFSEATTDSAETTANSTAATSNNFTEDSADNFTEGTTNSPEATSNNSAEAQTSGKTSAQPSSQTPERVTDQASEQISQQSEAQISAQSSAHLPSDFLYGMDASSVLAEENSGVVWYDFDGNEQDVFRTLAEAGIDCIRLRIWNNPYDEEGRGYGGGNNDVPTAVTLGKRATDNGMSVCADFHYSDFWSDPSRQYAPKAWADLSVDEKSDALYSFTKESLSEMLDAGVDVTMVQIGNEINNGMAGEHFIPNVEKLLAAGSRAVREISNAYEKEIKIIVHYTSIDNPAGVYSLLNNLQTAGVDYDTVGLSYYPYWNGTMENMQKVVRKIREDYEKEVMIVETAYPYTTVDGDGSANSFSGTSGLVKGYTASVEGQAKMITDIAAAAADAGASGLFYWEGCWIPVQHYRATDADAAEILRKNNELWEQYGSGWASSYAADYDPDNAGKYWGGCSWDNQALFDFDGHPLESLNVFKD